MNKDEYVYLHALLYRARTYLENEGNVSPETFETYDELAIRPPHIYKQKEKHKNAIRVLSSELAEAAELTQKNKQLTET